MDLFEKMKALNQGYSSDLELAGVVQSTPVDQFPYENEKEDDGFLPKELSIQSFLNGSSKKTSRKPKRTKSLLDDPSLESVSTAQSLINHTHEAARRMMESNDLLIASDFDSFISSDIFADDEDVEMKNHLISMGRKYHRDTAVSQGVSEVQKTFADSEKNLKKLFEEVGRDKEEVQTDIKRMRVPGRGGKILADMISAKNALHSTQLSIIKEINGIHKLKFDLQAKIDAKKEAENTGSNDISANTIQQLFSASRQEIISSAGGYANVSGSQPVDAYAALDDMTPSDEELEARYYHPTEESDGDKFLRYEDRGVHLVLLVDDDFNVQNAIAEDKDGVYIPEFDYPVPNISDLEFNFDKVAMTATDNLHRNYVVRKVEE